MQEKTEQWYNLSDAVVRRLSNGDLEYLSAAYVTEIESQLSTLRAKAELATDAESMMRWVARTTLATPRDSAIAQDWVARYDALTTPAIQAPVMTWERAAERGFPWNVFSSMTEEEQAQAMALLDTPAIQEEGHE